MSFVLTRESTVTVKNMAHEASRKTPTIHMAY
jgi:hypothetical protein